MAPTRRTSRSSQTTRRRGHRAAPGRTTRRAGGRSRRGAVTRTRTTRTPRTRTASAGSRSTGADGRRSRDGRFVQEFLDGFTQAVTAGDGEAAASFFEYPAVMVMSNVGDYGGTQLLQDEGTVAEFFAQAPKMYHARGIFGTFPDLQSIEWVADDLALAKVRLPYLDEDGDDMGDGETSVYLLRRTGGDLAICAAVTLGTDSDRAQM
jgi:hypothetical protein